MRKIIYISMFLSVTFFFLRCTEVGNYLDPTDKIAPGSVSNVAVENYHGGARITYSLPPDADILGVKAVYSFDETRKDLETFSSAFRDTIELEGFPDTSERVVKLYCIDKSRNESLPVEATIQPLTPPVQLIRKTLNVKETFGGVFSSWENITQEDIGISLYMEDSTGAMVFNYAYYSNASDGKYAFRGLEGDIERKFELLVHDKWGNYSTPLDTLLTPVFEEKLEPYSEYGVLLMTQYGVDDGTCEWRGDVPRWAQNASQDWPDMFDNNIGSMFNTGNQGNLLKQWTDRQEDNFIVAPAYWILDLGRPCRISRHKFWHWTTRTLAGVAPKHFELWATNELPEGGPTKFSNRMESLAYWTGWPQVDGYNGWHEGWDLVADCWCVPPSGQTDVLKVTADEVAWAKANGFEFDIYPEFTTKPYRYLRFVVKLSWSESNSFVQVGDVEFWGREVSE